jgi:hypothetical protein
MMTTSIWTVTIMDARTELEDFGKLWCQVSSRKIYQTNLIILIETMDKRFRFSARVLNCSI